MLFTFHICQFTEDISQAPAICISTTEIQRTRVKAIEGCGALLIYSNVTLSLYIIGG